MTYAADDCRLTCKEYIRTLIDERTYQLDSKKWEERWKQRYVPVGGYTALMHVVIVGDV